DAAGRPVTATTSAGTSAFTYDATGGRLATATTPDGQQVAYTYDGLLTKSIVWSGPVNGDVEGAYDKFQKLAWEPAGSSFGISYAYDGDGLVTKAGQMTLTQSSTTGLLTGTTLRNVTDTITYDAFGARATYTAKSNNATVFAHTYTRDALARLATKSE